MEDRVHGFLDAHCELAADRYVHADELWQAYRDYATTQGRHSGNAAEFVKRLAEHDLIAKRGDEAEEAGRQPPAQHTAARTSHGVVPCVARTRLQGRPASL